jgi:methanogenic corrinoid protein MtbC1
LSSARSSASPPALDDGVAEEYLDALGRGDELWAIDLVTGLLDAGSSPQDVLLQLVSPAQARVGELWESGRWSVAQEHAATCVAERVVAVISTRTRRTSGGRGHVVLSCLDGEWHALAARIVVEVLRLHDWQVTFLGASVPPVHLVSFLHQHGPDVVALSAALPIHLPAARHTIVAAQRTGTPVLAGGPGFGADGCFARSLGVDAWSATAADAVGLLDRMPWPEPTVPGPADAGAEAEYAGVRERRGRLVLAALETLRSRPGPVKLADSALDDDLGQVVDFLAAATYFADRGLFANHLGWLARVAAPRGAPDDALPDVLDAFRAELHDFPFAQACLDAGHEVLAGRS